MSPDSTNHPGYQKTWQFHEPTHCPSEGGCGGWSWSGSQTWTATIWRGGCFPFKNRTHVDKLQPLPRSIEPLLEPCIGIRVRPIASFSQVPSRVFQRNSEGPSFDGSCFSRTRQLKGSQGAADRVAQTQASVENTKPAVLLGCGFPLKRRNRKPIGNPRLRCHGWTKSAPIASHHLEGSIQLMRSNRRVKIRGPPF